MNATQRPSATPERQFSVPSNLRRTIDAASIARRHFFIRLTKWLLPIAAVGLLLLMAIWPELQRVEDSGRLAIQRSTDGEPNAARIVEARYRSVDNRNRPYMVTADSAEQVDQDSVRLHNPIADVTTESGSWMQAESASGLYHKQQELLALSDNVTMWHDNGAVLRTRAMTLNIKDGSASSSTPVSIQGPFGTLDAQGFTLTGRGAVVHFTGQSHLVLNENTP